MENFSPNAGEGYMRIDEWLRIEDLMVAKFGWKKGIMKMCRAKRQVTDGWLEAMNRSQDNKLRRIFRQMGLK